MSNPRRRVHWKALGILVAVLVANALVALPVGAGQQPGSGSSPKQEAVQAQIEAYIQRVVDLTNQERTRRGLRALTIDPALNRAALAHSQDMADRNYFSHTGANGSDPGDRIAAAGYSPIYAWGENIAAGQSTPEEVVAAWMNSEGHREVLLSTWYADIGVGMVNRAGTTYGYYWSQEFASHSAEQLKQTPAPVKPSPTPTRVRPSPTPTRVPTKAPTVAPLPPLPGTILDQYTQRVVELVNQRRATRGLPPLTINAALSNAAQGHSEDMAIHSFFRKTGSDGSTPRMRMLRAGYRPISLSGEVIAGGQPTPEEVVAAWMSNDLCRRRLLNRSFRDIGVGYAYNPNSRYQQYWTADLAAHGSRQPTALPASSLPSLASPLEWLINLLPSFRPNAAE